jgi:Subtilase family
VAQHPHIIVPKGPDPVRFTSPSSGPRDRMELPSRQRAAHAQRLIAKLDAIAASAKERAEEQKAYGIDEGLGIYLTFESEPNFELKFESLDIAKSGIELCTIKTSTDNRTQATIFVPDGKLKLFLSKIAAYRDKMTTPREEGGPTRPKNQDFVESIADIQLAALEALWTENDLPFPEADAVVMWEVWLRRFKDVDHLVRLRAHAQTFDLTIGQQTLSFVDRKVVLVHGTARSLSRSIDILGMIAELRLPKTTAAFFTDMNAIDQQAWVDDLAARSTAPGADIPYVCLFDTGINHAHPLLAQVAAAGDAHAYKPAWGTDDRQGHGTPMAGLVSYGDLTDALASAGPIAMTHRVESVKIIHPADPNDVELYGAVTQESTYRVEVIPDRQRVFCMAVTAPDGRDRGRPSSWSAAIDSLAAGVGDDGDQRRLFILSGGNTDPTQRHLYPDSNMTDGIHDPGQAWNALTVGGYTDKALIDAVKYPGWEPLAARGDLSPASCTSLTWGKWPIKPDIVMEAGNMGRNAAITDPDYIDDGLQLLSTGHDFLTRKALTSFGDTSAATALAARYAALLWAKYPALAPETVRALMVHAADWTPAMLARSTGTDGSIDYRNLVRCFGRGVPDLRRLLSSLDNSLTLVVESKIQPFFKDEEGDNRVKTREMRLHPLPWPIDVLSSLQNTPVIMRVTLSYFVEPSPGARGWTPRYGYQSHGLRFAVRNPLENAADFERRVNKFAREEDYEAPGLSDPGWDFGHNMRSLTSIGSIHSDVWRGTAINLASRGHLAVFPTMGWWNKRQYLNGWEKSACYSLLVTIETPEVETDLYTPVASQVGVPIVVEA